MHQKPMPTGAESSPHKPEHIECKWEEPDPYACMDEQSCGCYTDPCTLYGVDPAYCMDDDPCACCC